MEEKRKEGVLDIQTMEYFTLQNKGKKEMEESTDSVKHGTKRKEGKMDVTGVDNHLHILPCHHKRLRQ